MKKGFTMIELIFVIVILGVLAAIAIPRLAATRDDAEIVKASTNLTTAISDLTAYYVSQGKFADDIMKMTNVSLERDGANVGSLKVGSAKCFNIIAYNEKLGTEYPAHIVIQKSDGTMCDKVAQTLGVKALLSSGFSIKKSDGTIDSTTYASKPGKGYIAVGGSEIVW